MSWNFSFFLFWKNSRPFSTKKYMTRPAPNELKEKRNFWSSSCSLGFFSARLQFYMQCTLSINYLRARSLFITSVMCLCFHLRPASTLEYFSFEFIQYLFFLFFCLFFTSTSTVFNAKINKKMCVSHHQVCPNFIVFKRRKWEFFAWAQ